LNRIHPKLDALSSKSYQGISVKTSIQNSSLFYHKTNYYFDLKRRKRLPKLPKSDENLMQFVERIGNFKISLLQIKSSNVSWLCYLNPINISACEETQNEID